MRHMGQHYTYYLYYYT